MPLPTTPYATIKSTLSGEFPPDFAVLNIVLTAEAASRSAAVRKVNAMRKTLVENLKEVRGIANAGFSKASAGERQIYDTTSDSLTIPGFEAGIMGMVQVVTPVAETVATIVADSGGRLVYVAWVLADEDGAYQKVRTAVIGKARAAAEDYAAAAGMALGSLRSITDTGIPMMEAAMQQPMGSAPPSHHFGIIPQDEVNLDPTPLKITVVADVSYELVPLAPAAVPTPATS